MFCKGNIVIFMPSMVIGRSHPGATWKADTEFLLPWTTRALSEVLRLSDLQGSHPVQVGEIATQVFEGLDLFVEVVTL